MRGEEWRWMGHGGSGSGTGRLAVAGTRLPGHHAHSGPRNLRTGQRGPKRKSQHFRAHPRAKFIMYTLKNKFGLYIFFKIDLRLVH